MGFVSIPHAGLASYSRDLNCTLRSGSTELELSREQKSSTDSVRPSAGGITLFQDIIYQMGPLNGKQNYFVVKETPSDLIYV